MTRLISCKEHEFLFSMYILYIYKFFIMGDTCHNLISDEWHLMVSIYESDESWVQGPICYFCIL